jgi:hypothetical protein
MDDGFAIAIMSLVLGVFGIVIGVGIGEELSKKATSKKRYWQLNGYVYLVGILVSFLIWCTGWVLFAFVTIGALAGAIAGLKMGYGQAIGPWKAHDRFMRANGDAAKDPRRTREPRPFVWPWQKKSKAAGWAQRKPEGEPESEKPVLMSVQDPGDRASRSYAEDAARPAASKKKSD